jgi:diacylglycerol kinase family enzyme
MYYYIIEPSKGQFGGRSQEKIKDILGDLGIAGETVTPGSARTIEELAHLGVVKGYSTIVAVGSEALVNKIITVLATEKLAKDTVLGIVPSDYSSPLARHLGVTDIYSACNALKSRKLETVNLCLIEPNKYFLTEAVIESFFNKEIFFSMEGIKGKALTRQILIQPGLKVTLHDKSLEGGVTSKFIRWLFGRKESDIYTSSFMTHRIRFESEKENLPVKVSGEIVAKTPATFVNRGRILKIIVARDRMKQKDNK